MCQWYRGDAAICADISQNTANVVGPWVGQLERVLAYRAHPPETGTHGGWISGRGPGTVNNRSRGERVGAWERRAVIPGVIPDPPTCHGRTAAMAVPIGGGVRREQGWEVQAAQRLRGRNTAGCGMGDRPAQTFVWECQCTSARVWPRGNAGSPGCPPVILVLGAPGFPHAEWAIPTRSCSSMLAWVITGPPSVLKARPLLSERDEKNGVAC